MSRVSYGNLNPPSGQPPRDSLELASLASSTPTETLSSPTSSPSGISSSRKLSFSNDDPLRTPRPGAPSTHGRSYSVSSAFDFASNLFPLSSTAAGYTALGAQTANPLDLNGASLEKHKSLTFFNGLSLMLGLMIGSGIFSSPSQVNNNAGSSGAALIVWTIAGVLAWTGAASYAELGGAIPLNGGAQAYLSKIFGELAGFLFTWVSVFVLKPGSAAIISIIFGEYIVRAVVGAEVEDVSRWVNKLVSMGGLVLVTSINCVSTKLGTRLGDTLMIMKILALLGITITGLLVAATGHTLRGKANMDWKTKGFFEGTSSNPSGWAVALYAGLWAFDGWDNVNYVVGEFINPHRDFPRVIHTAMPLVIVSYLLANVSYIFVLPSQTVASTNTIAVQFGSVVFGPTGSLILALIVSASCFGTLNAGTFTSGRLVYAAGKEGFLPSVLGSIGMPGMSESANRSRRRSWLYRTIARILGDENGGLGFTPINAMVFNSVLCAGYIIVGEFGTLVTFNGVAGYTFYFLTVLGCIVLRVREPYLARPYRTWISTPIIFCCVSLFLLSRAVVAQPVQTLMVVAFVAAGVPVWWWRVRGRGKGRQGVGVEWRFWRRWGRS